MKNPGLPQQLLRSFYHYLVQCGANGGEGGDVRVLRSIMRSLLSLGLLIRHFAFDEDAADQRISAFFHVFFLLTLPKSPTNPSWNYSDHIAAIPIPVSISAFFCTFRQCRKSRANNGNSGSDFLFSPKTGVAARRRRFNRRRFGRPGSRHERPGFLQSRRIPPERIRPSEGRIFSYVLFSRFFLIFFSSSCKKGADLPAIVTPPDRDLS